LKLGVLYIPYKLHVHNGMSALIKCIA